MKNFLLVGILSTYILVWCSSPLWPSSQSESMEYTLSLTGFSRTIHDSQEFQDCIEPAINMCVGSVGMQIAQKRKSLDLCNELPSLEQKENCRFALTLSNAHESWDPTACNSLSWSYQVQCLFSAYKNIASTKKDITLCDSMSEAVQKAYTEVGTWLIQSINLHHDRCILWVAISDKNAPETLCDSIVDHGTKDSCLQATKNY